MKHSSRSSNTIKRNINRRQVIKESRVMRPTSSRHIIKEWDDWDYWDLVLKHAKEVANRFIKDPTLSKIYREELLKDVCKEFCDYDRDYDDVHESDGVAAMILERRLYIFTWDNVLKRQLIGRPGHGNRDERYWINKYQAQAEGAEGDWFSYLEGNRGQYERLEPFYKSIADEILEKFRGLDFQNAKKMMKGQPFQRDEEDDTYAESKKVNTKKHVIKESVRPRRHTRKLIKEDRLTQNQWLDMLQEKFDGVVKGLLEKYPNDVISSIDTSYFSSDPEDNACQILDGLFVDLIDRFPQDLLTERDLKWINKYSDQWEGCEGLWSDYCWGGNDVGAYKCLREKFPVLADFVDKYVKEHPYEGTNAKYHYTDPRAENPPFPTKAPVTESKKVSTRKKLIKESVEKPVRRHTRRIRK